MRSLDCPRCEELAEEVAYLRGELKTSVDATDVARVKFALGLRPAETAMLMALYQAKGRVVPHYELEANGEPSSLAAVYIFRLRRSLGKGFVLNDWGRGYRLSPEAIARIDQILSTQEGGG